MSLTKVGNAVLAVGALGVATWMVAEDGFYAFMRYSTFLLAIVANGVFLLCLLENPRVKSKVAASTLVMVLANCWVGYLVFPMIGLVVGFWIPPGIGLLFGFIFRRHAKRP